MERSSRIYVAGATGMVGRAICAALARDGYHNIVRPTRAELDLTCQEEVKRFYNRVRPDYVFVAAAKVGGIFDNSSHPVEFIRDNLEIQNNVISGALDYLVKKLLFLGSSCIYPRCAEQPIREESLLTGPLEPTNQPYAIAKIAGLELCRAYRKQFDFRAIALMPTNLYGPHDRFTPLTSHVVPALMLKLLRGKLDRDMVLSVWGSGKPRREFLHVQDLADACLFAMKHYDDDLPLNVGWGKDISIAELAELLCKVAEFEGEIEYDLTKPDGTTRKLLDVSRMRALGWEPRINLLDGLTDTWRWLQANYR